MKDNGCKPTTNDAGIPVSSDALSLTAGPDGPILLHDHYLVEQMANFNREMIPDRQPHAKGSGAFGHFEVTQDVSAYTKAAGFQPGTKQAKRILRFRQDANFTLATILWGNVSVNVLLALLSDTVLGGVAAFLFSTVVITVFAEIIPQAYFSRHALRVAALLSPLLQVYQLFLFPIARPAAWFLDTWLGGEQIRYFPERDLRRVLQLHIDATESDITRMEGQGALNFLDIDDVPLDDEGQPIDPDSVLQLEFVGNRPVFPAVASTNEDEFLRRVNRSGRSWVVIVDPGGEPRLVLDADDFLREALFAFERFNPYRHCHRPIVVRDAKHKLGDLIQRFRVRPGPSEDILEEDVILLWHDCPRVVTGNDILGRLLRGIARSASPPPMLSGLSSLDD